MNLTDHNDNPLEMDDLLSNVGPGWHPLIRILITDLFEAGWTGQVMQVKEKFGGLRFYAECDDERQARLINTAEDRSYSICEQCGAAGKACNAPGTSWIKTLCKTHRAAA